MPGSGERSLVILTCGRQVAGKGHMAPMRIYPNYSLTFVLKGRGVYQVNDKRYTIEAGMGFLIEKGSSVSYKADEEEPWEYIFVIFKGLECRAILGDIGVSAVSPVFCFGDDEKLRESLEKMLLSARAGLSSAYAVTAHFLMALSCLASGSRSPDNRERYIEEAIVFIENNASCSLSVEEIAEHLHIDRSYLYRLFMEAYGVSPKRYLLDYRLSLAAALLRDPQCHIEEVAEKAGFFDRAHFTHAFTEKYGLPPGKWRQKNA